MTHYCRFTPRSKRVWPSTKAWFALGIGVAALVASTATAQNAYLQHNLVSDIPGQADRTDTNLVNPWGIATSSSSPFWVSDNHSGLSTLYNSTGGVLTLVVNIPTAAGGQPPASPTGIIFNGSASSFLIGTNAARFIFSTEDGTISAWNSGSNAVLKVDNSSSGAIYKGLALANSGGSNFLYATDFHNGKVDVFDAAFQPVSLPGAFSDAALPTGFAPFGIQALNGNLYVTYALQDANKEDDTPGAGNGFVNVFDPAGKMLQRFASQGPLDSPWGITMAPQGFGQFSGALLIGNFGDGQINAFDPATGAALGTLNGTNGTPISIQGLWALKFGNGGQGGDPLKLYFTAGIPGSGSVEDHGLFGSLSVASSIPLSVTSASGTSATLQWSGGTSPYLIQRKNQVSDTNWFDVATTTNQTEVVATFGSAGLYRLLDHATNPVTDFTVFMTPGAEGPGVTSSGSGFGIMSLKGNTLSYNIQFSGLSGPAVAAHIHGPADTTQATNVVTPFVAPSATSGVLSGTVDVSSYSSNLLAALKTGRTYVNIHTAAHPTGELRGQIAPVAYTASLTGDQETPAVTTPGTGNAVLSLVGNQLFWNVTYSGLTSAAVAAHVHGRAPVGTPAPVLFGIGKPTGTSGTLTGSQTLTPDQLSDVIDGQSYLNVHTTNNGGGEIRGQISPE